MKTRNGLFADVPENLWNDWHWQVANRAETIEDLKKYMTLTPDEEAGVAKTLGKLRMAVTPYYLSLIDLNDPFDPIRKMAIPRAEELEYADYEDADPLHEDTDSPTPGLTHRYPDRVLLLITDQCSMYCRHCTRRRFAGQNDCEVPMAQIDKCIDYVAAHPEVRDVLLSGGDCLMVDDDNLEYIIKRLRAIPHVEIVRLGSRTPVVCPQRITPELCAMLKKYHPIWLNTHFNTPKEFSPEAAKACAMLADAGIPLGNQSVLLAGVNDCIHVMMDLVHGLVQMRVRPYYIYACDPSLGLSHFRTPVSKGIESWRPCAAIPPATASPPSWWTPPAAAVRPPLCLPTSSLRLPARSSCVTSRVLSPLTLSLSTMCRTATAMSAWARRRWRRPVLHGSPRAPSSVIWSPPSCCVTSAT